MSIRRPSNFVARCDRGPTLPAPPFRCGKARTSVSSEMVTLVVVVTNQHSGRYYVHIVDLNVDVVEAEQQSPA
ncbi:unnamed protein product [Phytophthora lilii]|uniref:Unnamed protein product n=1 Tax=Phytophthora lilii TaxID=2077276 RepID=A0A9W6XR55_9STRA|nr:unnamed protein product [Phytophthora lilii]GMF45013.1 unnamed protein product [Phytophthora lilii]GMF45017.1 unnamed protein product [Phytophthora lilii]